MTYEEEEQQNQERCVSFLLEATRELVAALEAEQARDPGDEVAENLCEIQLSVALLRAAQTIRYMDRSKESKEWVRQQRAEPIKASEQRKARKGRS